MRNMMAFGLGLLALAACARVPDDTGVGFGPYDATAQARAARATAPQPQSAPAAPSAGSTADIADIAAVAGGAIAAAEARPAATPGAAAISD